MHMIKYDKIEKNRIPKKSHHGKIENVAALV
jgi:hypothetical protein